MKANFWFHTTLWAVLIMGQTWAQYKPDWESVDARPLPSWYDEVKLGIFIHWGVFSVPSYGPQEEWIWFNWESRKRQDYVNFMENNYRPDFTYADFAPELTTEFFDPDEWADIFQASGAKYVVLTAKHHEGYTLWPSKVSFNWNAMDVGPKKDLVGLLANSIRNKTDIHFGLYHSMFEWFHPLYLQDKANGFKTSRFVDEKTLPELIEIVEAYKPEVLYSDGDWEAPDTYWKSTDFLAWLYNDSPVKDIIVVNDRWGIGTSCKHGGYYDCGDRFNPGVLQHHKWEMAFTIDRESWGFNRAAALSVYLSIEELIKTVVTTISCGGNALINVGPTRDGRIVPIFEERLRQFGSWVKVTGEGIYGTKPWIAQNDTETPYVWYTSKKDYPHIDIVYAFVLEWPKGGKLTLGAANPRSTEPVTKVSMLGYEGTFQWEKRTGGGMTISVPPISPADLPCRWAWVLKLENLLFPSD